MNIIRKYIQNILCLASIGFVAVDQSTQAVEYLITTTPGTSVTSGTIAQDLNYGQYDTPQADQTYYIRFSYTSAEATTWQTILSGNFEISIGDTAFGNVNNVIALDPDGNWPVYGINTGIAGQQYYGNFVNENGWTPDSTPPPASVHYLTLGQFYLKNVSTQTNGTTQISVTLAPDNNPPVVDFGGQWNTGINTQFYVNPAAFNITVVPEPSTMVTAALACAALGAVAAKKRKRQAVTA
jgi:hypothetical protein